MKKYIAWALAALLIVPVSCNKGGGDTHLDEPATKDLAQVIKFSKPAAIGAYGVQTIELTEAGRYIVTCIPVAKADGDAPTFFGTFTYSNGAFNLSGFGRITINGNQVTITTETAGGSPVTANATITPTTTSDTPHDNLCRNWKIGKTILGLSGGSFGKAGIEKVFSNGIDMNEITKWIDDNISISDQDKQTLLKYSVREVSLTGAGTLAVNFSQADPFVGTYALNGTRIAFSFDASDIPFITSGQFSGTVTFDGTTCNVVATATMVHNGKNYNATLEMAMTEIK
jgi:hypothetical protein